MTLPKFFFARPRFLPGKVTEDVKDIFSYDSFITRCNTLPSVFGPVRTIAKDAVSALVNVSAEDTSVAALEDMCKAGIVSR